VIGESGSVAPQKPTAEHGWSDFAGYFSAIERGKTSVNLLSYVGLGQVRELVMGNDERAPKTAELEQMSRLVADAMKQGAYGVSTGLIYSPNAYAKTDELIDLTEWLGEFRQGLAALAKIVGLLQVPVSITQKPDAVDLPSSGTLALRNVTFGYRKRPVVRDLTLEVAPGEHVALVGATGAGKSTVAKLLTRQYDPQQGRIELAGVDLRDATLASLRQQIVLLPQEGHLFTGTIGDNVRLAHPDAPDEEVRRALRRIGALDRFEALPQGLDTDVQTRGLRLSAGERQLVGIARIALADPAVIVLDEATSSLDPATEVAVETALSAVAEGRTVITIAHRLSTAQRADRVAVMEHGRLVEVASHDELVEQGERYARLWASWQAGLTAGV